MEDYELEACLGHYTIGNGELEDFVSWMDHDEGHGFGDMYEKGSGAYGFTKWMKRELHTNNMIYVSK